MKKRLLSLVLCLVMVFSLLPSFAMAEVFPVTDETESVEIRFYDSENKLINTQRVIKQNPTDTIEDGAIYDPGCPLPEGDTKYIFDKWSWGSSQTGTVDDILNYIRLDANWDALKGTTPNKGLNVTATLTEVRYLVYRDENNRVLKTDYVVAATSTDGWNIDVNYDYVPVSTSDEFFGWTTQAMDAENRDVQYENKGTAGEAHPEKIELTGTYTNLYPVCKTGYWLMFDNYIEQDGDTTNATFASPVLYRTGDHTAAPSPAPTRAGYTLEGWYTDKNFNNKYTFGSEINADTTLYAHWTPNTGTKYTVVFWQQKTTDAMNATDAQKTYDFYKSEERYAATGASVFLNISNSGTAADNRRGGNSTSSIGEMGYYFTYNSTNSDTGTYTVKGDGSTVLNVYYDRKTITINFHEYITSGYDMTSNGTGYYNIYTEHYGYYNGSYYYLEPSYNSYYVNDYGYIAANRVTWYYRNSSTTYTGTIYHYGKSTSSNTVIQTLTGLYDAPLTNWPDPGDGYEWNSNSGSYNWDYGMTLPVYSYKIWGTDGKTHYDTTWDIWIESEGGSNAKTAHYLGQDTDGNYTINLADYDIYYYHSLTIDNDLFQGYSMYSYRYGTANNANAGPEESLENVEEYKCANGGDDDTFGSYSQITFKYQRNKWDFIFNSNNEAVKTEQVFFQKNLSDLASYVPTNGPDGYYFDGWYADPAFGTPFDFNTTMPNNKVQIYAKWTKMRFRIVLDPTGGDSTIAPSSITFPPVSEGKPQATTFRVDYGEAVGSGSLNQAVREGYELVGWYVDAAKTKPFNFSYVTYDQLSETDMTYKDASTSARQGTDLWTGVTYDDADGDHDDVVGKLTIYAKWRQTMNADEYITVVYDANEAHDGTGAPNDDLHYADQAQAIAQPASKSGVSGETFAAWQVLGADGETVVDEIQPGEIFSVRLANSVEGTGVDENGDPITTHTVTLRARYTADTKTHVTWVGNGGTAMVDGAVQSYVNSGDANLNAKIDIMPANTFSNEDGAFLGWARLDENKMWDAENKQWKDPAAVEGVGSLDADDVWLKWDEDNNHWIIQSNDASNGKTALGIAANEDLPYHVLYAVWEKYETNDVRLMDYGVTGTVATGVKADSLKTKYSGFNLSSDGTLTFKYIANDTSFAENADGSIVGWNYNYSGIASAKTATYRDTNNKLHKVTVVAASSAYFDDDLNSAAKTELDGSGVLDSTVATNDKDTDGEKITRITINFVGTGIDVYCTSASDSGRVSYKLDGVGGVMVNKNGAEGATYYNAPTIRKLGLTYGPHELVITCGAAAKYKLDGIRIYGATENTNQATELKAVYQNLRTILQESGAVSTATEVDGAVFVPGGEAADKGYKDGTINEIMLSSGQGVAFQVDGMETADKMYIGLASAAGGAAQVTVSFGENAVERYDFSNTVHTFYEVKTTSGGYVYIKNTGANLVSVTDLKIVPAATRMFSFRSSAPLMRYVESFDALPLASEVVETTPEPSAEPEPTPSADPEPTQQPTFQDIISDLLSSFVNALFGSISRLFGRP